MKVVNKKLIPENPEEQLRLEKVRFRYKEECMRGWAGCKLHNLMKMGNKPGQVKLDEVRHK